MPQMLNLDLIDYDPLYYPRVNGNPDWMTILQYTEALQVDPEKEFPPIVVVRATGMKTPYLLIDGLHRLRSYVKAGREKIPTVVERIPKSKWMARSVELNATHGRRLDTGDKAWIATRLQEEGWQLTDIAGLMKMRVESLERIVATRCIKITNKEAELIPVGRSNRATAGGKHYGYLKAPFSEVNGKVNTLEALETQHSVTSHDVQAILDSMISVLRSGAVNMADEEVAERVGEIKSLLRDY